MVVVDASILLLFLSEKAGASVPDGHARVQHLIDTLSEAKERIVVPTPALSECLVHAGPAASDYVTIIEKHAAFRVASFDQRAAIEAAIRIYEARQRGQRKGGNPGADKAKIKYDRQIVAIAAVEGATTIYCDDDDIVAYARDAGIETIRLAELPEPPHDPQQHLPLRPPGEE
jgi:predicted nucleic acid-binding protein